MAVSCSSLRRTETGLSGAGSFSIPTDKGHHLLKKFFQCIGLASLILVTNYGDLLGGGYDVRMHVPFSLRPVILAHIADIFLLGLLLFAILTPLARTRARRWVRLALAALLPAVLALRLRTEFEFAVPIGIILLGTLLWAGFVFLLLLRRKGGYRRLLLFGDAFGIFLAAFALCSLLQLLYVARWRPGPQQHAAAWSTTAQPPRNHARIVWIVFDELSFDQLFEHRAPGLNLPGFDALRAESTVFTGVQPIGDKTVKVIPSLLTGSAVGSYRFSFGNRLSVRAWGAHGYHPLEGSGTVFADAQYAGWRTAATGWYNPYCTLFAGAIDDCYWNDLDKLDGPMDQTATLQQNIAAPLRQAALEVFAPARAARSLCDDDVRQRYKTHIDLAAHAHQMLQQDQADFIFLHLPVPHSPSIWSRAAGTYTQQCGGSYLDGLALADRELGDMLRILERSPRWSQTTVIVEGDHSWRSYLWQWQPAWTAEDARASSRGFDARPAVLIHQASQTQPQTIAAPWSLLNVHNVIEQVLHGQPVRF